MTTNKWINRAAVIVLLVCIYAAGFDSGRNQVTLAHHNQPQCHD